jgi:hypothetical protein
VVSLLTSCYLVYGEQESEKPVLEIQTLFNDSSSLLEEDPDDLLARTADPFLEDPTDSASREDDSGLDELEDLLRDEPELSPALLDDESELMVRNFFFTLRSIKNVYYIIKQ